MVASGLWLDVFSYWSPTRSSAERADLMRLEFSVNQRGKIEYSVAEVAWRTRDLDEALSVLPSMMPKETLQKMRRLLRPWQQGRYTEAYKRSGGILNYLTPPWGTEQDEMWAEIVAAWKVTSFVDDRARQSAMRDLEQEWNHRPHPFFAGLTPAQVLIGGGEQERVLARDFLNHLTAQFDGKGFESEGLALVQSLTLLRAWQFQPLADGQRPVDVILAERSDLLARRAQILNQRGLE